ncbi:MAG: hypothetical protein IT304_01460 [Dehalococcoidia bacterium]|nr:hypothetical protein [Dehalococcoidia bacterium]
MDLDERFRHSLRTLELLRAELLDAREAARAAEGEWGGWSVRFNQRLRRERGAMAVLFEPPPGADPRLLPLFEAAEALRELWDAINQVIQGGQADVAGRRIGMERALHRARDVIAAGG